MTCETLDKYGRATYRAKIVDPRLKRVLYEGEEKGGVLEALVGLVRSTSRKVRFIIEDTFEDESGEGREAVEGGGNGGADCGGAGGEMDERDG